MAQKKRRITITDMVSFSQLDTEEETTTTNPRWEGTIVSEGVPTGDGRLIEHDSLRWEVSEENPIPIRHVQEDVGAHDGAQVVGRIFNIERRDGGMIHAEGDFDMGSDIGVEAHRQVVEKLTRGVSVDLDDVSFEIRVAAEVLEGFEEAMLEGPEEVEDLETDDEGRVIVAEMSGDEELFVITDARVRAATLVATPAFADAFISVTDEGGTETPTDSEPAEDVSTESYSNDALIAAAAPNTPPSAWFDQPKLDGPTALQVTKHGQVYGHVATWDTCHIADPNGNGQCVTAPRSATDYAYFHTGSVLTKEGTEQAVGHITMDTGHAKPNASPTSAMSHYDNTGAVVADVKAGEDQFGIWIAGAVRPSVTEDQVRALRSAPLSGDWRRVGGNLEMVAALAVNVPGFPIPRTQGLVASGNTASLVAAGVVAPTQEDLSEVTLTASDMQQLKRMLDHNKKQERNALKLRVQESKQKMAKHKVNSFVGRKGKK